jgi:hypothetical protein
MARAESRAIMRHKMMACGSNPLTGPLWAGRRRSEGCRYHSVPIREEHELGRRLARACLRALA